MDLQKGKGRPGLPGLKLGGAPPQGQVQQHLTWLETGKDESYGHATYCYDWGGNYFRLDKVLDLLDRLFQRQSLCQVPSHGRRGIFVEHVVNLFSIDICKTSIKSLERKVRNRKWVNLFSARKTSIIQPRADHSQPHSLLAGGESPHSPTGGTRGYCRP